MTRITNTKIKDAVFQIDRELSTAVDEHKNEFGTLGNVLFYMEMSPNTFIILRGENGGISVFEAGTHENRLFSHTYLSGREIDGKFRGKKYVGYILLVDKIPFGKVFLKKSIGI